MSAVTSASARWVLLWLSLVAWTEAKVVNITAKAGHKVALPCKTTLNNDFRAVEWTRPDQETERYVLLFRDGQIDRDSQLQSFDGRVSLADGWKDGDVSLILEDVKDDDRGRYECQVIQGTNRRKRSAETNPISTINLTVEPAGHRGHVLAVIAAVVAVVAIAVVGLVIFKRSRVNSSRPSEVMLV